MPQMEITAEDS